MSVFEHVTEELLHGGVPDGPVEEEQLDPLRADETQRGEEEEQLPEPAGTGGVSQELAQTARLLV